MTVRTLIWKQWLFLQFPLELSIISTLFKVYFFFSRVVHNSNSISTSKNRNVREQCCSDERSYLRQMSKRAWITVLALFGLFLTNSHATVFYKEDRPYESVLDCVLQSNQMAYLMANILWCCRKWCKTKASLSHTPTHCMFSYTLKPLTHLQSFPCCIPARAALFCSVFGCNNVVYPAQRCRRLIYPLSWLQHRPTDAERTSSGKERD